jgi:hypothetical protein
LTSLRSGGLFVAPATLHAEEAMSSQDRTAIERQISDVLLDQWDPLGVRGQPGPHLEYDHYAHDVYGLLARGASAVQISRYLHFAEGTELQRPELVERDLSSLVRALRAVNVDL